MAFATSGATFFRMFGLVRSYCGDTLGRRSLLACPGFPDGWPPVPMGSASAPAAAFASTVRPPRPPLPAAVVRALASPSGWSRSIRMLPRCVALRRRLIPRSSSSGVGTAGAAPLPPRRLAPPPGPSAGPASSGPDSLRESVGFLCSACTPAPGTPSLAQLGLVIPPAIRFACSRDSCAESSPPEKDFHKLLISSAALDRLNSGLYRPRIASQVIDCISLGSSFRFCAARRYASAYKP